MKQKVCRWKVMAGSVLIIVLMIAGIRLFNQPSEVITKIGGYAITQEHLALYEKEFRAEVTSYFYQTYQLNPNHESFWETEAGGETPADVLKQRAMDRLVYDTVERIAASRYGISSAITLKDITEALDKENASRQSAGSISYGPSQYGVMEYISRTQMEVRDQLKEKLLEGSLRPTDEQLKEVYNQADPALFDKGCKARIGIYMYYGMKVGAYPAELGPVWEFIAESLDQGMQPADILAAANEQSTVSIEYEEVEYDTANMPRDNLALAWLADQTRSMGPGEISKVVDYETAQGILTVLDKSDYGRAEYEDSTMLLRNLWLESAYPDYIAENMRTYGYVAKNR